MNTCILIGNVGKDPETKYLQSGDPVSSFSLATTYRSKNGDETEWHNVVCFKKQAELVEKYVKKGKSLCVTGRIRTRSYEKDGAKQYRTEIIANEIEFLGGPNKPEETKKQESRKGGIDSFESDVPW